MELKQNQKTFQNRTGNLLIVPYGIETLKKNPLEGCGILLIVPYGIETQECQVKLSWKSKAFNRTLWN